MLRLIAGLLVLLIFLVIQNAPAGGPSNRRDLPPYIAERMRKTFRNAYRKMLGAIVIVVAFVWLMGGLA
ncbi:hypothetical protein AC629_13605 [Bradyrhizobium sp. NAS80.1]|uniref:hypothetical protein n=1 Tax=Bradyrhizobium sp. NAS80.1 TaxID=1680159 RepID=UPI0009681B12|nr:hypothetical protein [Bradyrhizobium sp. NAS80.1]OKO87571.1 hypothetical protein AC629_13605 [Bradyrhizobium sp. NAS80.1]